MEKPSAIHLPYAKSNLILPSTLYYRRQFSVSGPTASGKSTLVRLLLAELRKLQKPGEPEYREHSAGKFKRDLAKEKGFLTPTGEGDIDKLTAWEEAHPEFEFDAACDQRTREFGLRDYGVADGRLVRLFMPGSYKILIICSPHICAVRRAHQLTKQSQGIVEVTPVQALSMIRDRNVRDYKRYDDKYPGYDWAPDDFDLVIDNDKVKEEELPHLVLKNHAEWLNKMAKHLMPEPKPASVTSRIRTRAAA